MDLSTTYSTYLCFCWLIHFVEMPCLPNERNKQLISSYAKIFSLVAGNLFCAGFGILMPSNFQKQAACTVIPCVEVRA
jgi:hypothetical protein